MYDVLMSVFMYRLSNKHCLSIDRAENDNGEWIAVKSKKAKATAKARASGRNERTALLWITDDLYLYLYLPPCHA